MASQTNAKGNEVITEIICQRCGKQTDDFECTYDGEYCVPCSIERELSLVHHKMESAQFSLGLHQRELKNLQDEELELRKKREDNGGVIPEAIW